MKRNSDASVRLKLKRGIAIVNNGTSLVCLVEAMAGCLWKGEASNALKSRRETKLSWSKVQRLAVIYHSNCRGISIDSEQHPVVACIASNGQRPKGCILLVTVPAAELAIAYGPAA